MPKSSIVSSGGIDWSKQQQPVLTTSNTTASTLTPHLSVNGSGYLHSISQALAVDNVSNVIGRIKITIDGVEYFSDSNIFVIGPGATTDGAGTSISLTFKNLRFETSLLIEHYMTNNVNDRITTASVYSLDK